MFGLKVDVGVLEHPPRGLRIMGLSHGGIKVQPRVAMVTGKATTPDFMEALCLGRSRGVHLESGQTGPHPKLYFRA